MECYSSHFLSLDNGAGIGNKKALMALKLPHNVVVYDWVDKEIIITRSFFDSANRLEITYQDIGSSLDECEVEVLDQDKRICSKSEGCIPFLYDIML